MKTFEDILDEHIQKHCTTASQEAVAALKPHEVVELEACLKLHADLASLRVVDAAGKSSLRSVLIELDEPSLQENVRTRSVWRGLVPVFVSLLIIGFVGGFSLFTQNSSEPTMSNIPPADGSVENLQQLNLAEAENDSQITKTDTNIVGAAEVNLTSTSNVDEAIDENF